MIVNIWSHFLGTLLYSLVPLYYFPAFRSRYSIDATGDLAILAIYYLGVTVCFAFSTLYVTLESWVGVLVFF